MSTVDVPPAIAARTKGRNRNPRTLFISGAMTCARLASDRSSYQDQKPLSTSSSIWSQARARYAGTVSSFGRSSRVGVPGIAVRVSSPARRMSSVRGPQEEA